MAKKSTPSTKKSKPAKSGDNSLVDTSLAAEVAARMLSARKAGQLPANHSGETSLFKHLKESLDKPHSQTMGNVLDQVSTPSQKQSAAELARFKQVSHSQIVEGNVSRVSVPRRTAG